MRQEIGGWRGRGRENLKWIRENVLICLTQVSTFTSLELHKICTYMLVWYLLWQKPGMRVRGAVSVQRGLSNKMLGHTNRTNANDIIDYCYGNV